MAQCATTPTALAGQPAKALSGAHDPEGASRPWDKDRDGFVMGDGGGAVVLEELERAKARGARIYAECIGFGMSGDAYHITAPPEDGAGARLAMVNALNDAHLNPSDIQYLNAHATSTPLGDRAETVAIKRAFGDYAYKLAISSTKSMTGHLLGAAGVAEAIFSILAIRDGVAPPTTNYHTPDRTAISTTCQHSAQALMKRCRTLGLLHQQFADLPPLQGLGGPITRVSSLEIAGSAHARGFARGSISRVPASAAEGPRRVCVLATARAALFATRWNCGQASPWHGGFATISTLVSQREQ